MHSPGSVAEGHRSSIRSPFPGDFPSSMVSGSRLVIVGTIDISLQAVDKSIDPLCRTKPIMGVMSNRISNGRFQAPSSVGSPYTVIPSPACIINIHHGKWMDHGAINLNAIHIPNSLHISLKAAFNRHKPCLPTGQEGMK